MVASFVTEVFNNDLASWQKIKSDIIALEQDAFGSVSFSEEDLKNDFLDQKNTIVLLKKEDSQEVIGFTYAKPCDPETADGPAKPGETAWMWDTIIKKEYRGMGLLGTMMKCLEDELRARGFKYIERNSLKANGFAESIARHYKDRIIKSFSLDSKWGPQMFFRIRL